MNRATGHRSLVRRLTSLKCYCQSGRLLLGGSMENTTMHNGVKVNKFNPKLNLTQTPTPTLILYCIIVIFRTSGHLV